MSAGFTPQGGAENDVMHPPKHSAARKPQCDAQNGPQGNAGNGPRFSVRAMRAEDVPACAAIEASAPDAWGAEALAEELRQPTARLFVAEVGGAAQGARPAAQGAEALPPPGAAGTIAALAVFQLVWDEANLYTVVTAPDFRRQGAAHALLGGAFAALAEAGARTVFLEVRAQNRAARALYTALGFETVGLRRGFYQNPNDDAVLMRKNIAQRYF